MAGRPGPGETRHRDWLAPRRLPSLLALAIPVRDSQDPASFFQDVLVASEKIAMLVALAAFLSASLPMKPIRVIRLRYIRFSLFCPFVSGTRKRVGAAPKTKSCFSGGTGTTTTGEPEPEGCESKAEAAQTLGAARAPKQCRDERAGRGNVTEQITTLVVAASVGIPQSKPFAIRERRRQYNIRE